jgi:NADH-quinone oxidoreductase subunit N
MREPEARPVVTGGTPRPAIAGGSDDAGPVAPRQSVQPEVIAVALVCAAATIFFGLYPGPLLELAHDAGAALSDLF